MLPLAGHVESLDVNAFGWCAIIGVHVHSVCEIVNEYFYHS